MNQKEKLGFNSVHLTILVDNEVYLEGLGSTWGFSVYVEAEMEGMKKAVLMDTSGSFNTFTYNVSKLRVDLSSVDAIFISHWHGDHCGCLKEVLEMLKSKIPVYLPSYDRSGVKLIEKLGATPIICSKPKTFLEGFMSTGCLGRWTKEHSLIIKLESLGFILLTGCAHPGVIKIANHAKRLLENFNLRAVIGGFHISSRKEGKIVGSFMKENKVEVVSPCHCTGEDAKQAIFEVLGRNCARCGAGRTFHFSA